MFPYYLAFIPKYRNEAMKSDEIEYDSESDAKTLWHFSWHFLLIGNRHSPRHNRSERKLKDDFVVILLLYLFPLTNT